MSSLQDYPISRLSSLARFFARGIRFSIRENSRFPAPTAGARNDSGKVLRFLLPDHRFLFSPNRDLSNLSPCMHHRYMACTQQCRLVVQDYTHGNLL